MEKFLNLILNNKLLVIVLFLIVIISGYFSFKNLPIEAFPDVSPVLVQVFTETEGLSPEDVEKYVTYPIETTFNGLPNMRLVRSTSNFGLSVVNVYFEDGTDIYFARQVVGEKLQEAREKIPNGFGDPQMGPISTPMGLILFYYLEDKTNSFNLTELRTIQDWVIKTQLQTIKGVTEVLGIGGFERQFHVDIHPQALIKYNLTVQDIVKQVKLNNLNVGAQYITKDSEEFIVRSIGLAKGIKDLEKTVIKTIDGTPVYLNQVAHITEGGAIRRGIQTKNGKREVVAGMVIKLYGTNSFTVIEEVENKINEINKTLPKGVRIVPYYEQKSIIEASVNTVTNALLLGIILVIAVLVIFIRKIRSSLIVAISIPFSILFAALAMNYLGITANLMSLGGLAIAIGMLVDPSIVIVENINRMLEENNKNRLDTIKKAWLEVIKPISFAVIIVIFVFLPILLMEGVEGKTFKPLADTVILALMGALFYSVFFVPVISTFLVRKSSRISILNTFDILDKIKAFYLPFLNFFLEKKFFSIIIAGLLILTGIAIYPQLGSEFTPELNEGTIILRLTMAPSISLEESKKYTMIVERRIKKIPEVDKVLSRIGRGEVGAHADPINSAEMYITFKKDINIKHDDQEKLEKVIRESIQGLPGIQTNFTQPIAMTIDELLEGVRADLAIKIYGEDLDLLKEKADKIAEIIKEIKGAQDVQVDQVAGSPQLLILPDREKLARYGLNIDDVQQTIKTAVGGQVVGQIFEGIKRFDIFVRFDKTFRDTRMAISNIFINSSDNKLIPLSKVAQIQETNGLRQITRENNQRFIAVQCNVIDRDIGSFVKEAKQLIAQRINLPSGYFTEWGGQYNLQEQANKRFAIVIPITLIMIIILLFVNFNSFKDTLLIMLNIPLALVGGVVALWLTGQNLSVPSSIGFISLFGIALGNGMVLITYFNQLVDSGYNLSDAVVTGSINRLRPVLITAFTTAFGLIPLLLSTGTGSEVQKPLATVIIGGLVSSTILTLLILPVLYSFLSSCQENKEK
ncbi:MAG: CusA/CzcA family heavy metal efflux RND transporter [Cyanobacteriota bacterium]